MKKAAILFMAAMFALATAGASAVFGEEDGKWYSGELRVGATTALDKLHGDEGGAKGGMEYNSSVGYKWTTYLGGNLELSKNGFDLSADALYRDVDDQEYGGMVSFRRIFIYEADYSRFLHRLDHDYMDNLEAHVFPPAATGWKNWAKSPELKNIKGGKTVGSANVYHTDLAYDEMFEVTRSQLEHGIKLNIPQIPNLKFSFNHRFEQRKGEKQAMTNSKCLACHIVSRSQRVDETTNDINPRLSLSIGTLAMEFSYMHREFDADNEDLTNVYNGLKGKGLFLNRLQYDRTTGELPYSRTPDSTKDTYKGKLRWDINAHNTFIANYVYSQSSNRSTRGAYDILTGNYGEELDLDSNVVNAKFHSKLSRDFSINVFGKYQNLDNENVKLKKNVRKNPPGAPGGAVTLSEGYIKQSGHTYFEEEEVRHSGYNSDIYEVGTDITWRIMTGLRLRAGYEFKREQRNHYRHHNVTHSTKEHIVTLSTDWRVSHDLKFDFDYKFEYYNDPYVLKKAECTPDGSYGAYAGLPAGLYDVSRAYEPAIYGRRTAARSNMPEYVHEFKFKTHWHPMSMLMANAHVKYRYANNSDVDGTDWTRNFLVAGFSGTLTPVKDFVFSAGYTYFYDSYDSQFCIAIYDG